MIANLEPKYLTPEAYLEWEECQDVYPCLLVEVLSPSTEGYDRGGKFAQ